MYRSAFFNKATAQVSGVTPVAPVVSESNVTQAPFLLLAKQASSRTLKFPSSRKFLWDRTPLGRVEVFELKDNLPVICVPSDFHRRARPDRTVIAYVTCPNGSQLHISLQIAATSQESTHGSVVVPLTASAGGPSPDQVAALVQNLLHGLDWRGAGCLTAGFTLGLALQTNGPGVSAGDVVRGNGSPATLTATLLLPAVSLVLTPLYAKRLCDVPLVQTLSQMDAGATVQTGYLTMDQARSLLPLAADDSNVYSVPLVGVWVRGVRGTDHPIVYTAALQFAYGSTLPDRAVQPDGAFLVLIFTGESPVARCYEARFTDPAAPSQSRPQGQNARNDFFSPTGGPKSIDGAAVDNSGCCGFGWSGLRVLPYLVKAELTGQTAAPLELKAVLDTVTAAAAGPRLTLPPSGGLPGQTPQQPAQLGPTMLDAATTPHAGIGGSGLLGGRLNSTAGLGSTSRCDAQGFFHIRGSGSKLMTSPSKAMKILTTEGVGFTYSRSPGTAPAAASTWTGSAMNGACGPAASLPWAASRAASTSMGPARDSPPVPRSSAVPTPFRAAPLLSSDSARVAANNYSRSTAFATFSGEAESDAGINDSGVGLPGPPRDPRLQHRGAAAKALSDRSTSVAGPTSQGEKRPWASAVQAPAPSSSAAATSGVPAVLSAPSRDCSAGSSDWGESATGVMGTPALTLTRCDPESSVTATPRQPHNVTVRYAQLQERMHIAGMEATQQQEQGPQITMPMGRGNSVAAWTAAGMLRNRVRDLNTASQPAVASVMKGAVESSASQQHVHNPDSSGYRLCQLVSAAHQDPFASHDNHGIDVERSCGGAGQVQETAPAGGAVFASSGAEASANQGMDGWQHARGRVTASNFDSAIHSSTTSAIARAAVAAQLHLPISLPSKEAGGRSSDRNDSLSDECMQQGEASAPDKELKTVRQDLLQNTQNHSHEHQQQLLHLQSHDCLGDPWRQQAQAPQVAPSEKGGAMEGGFKLGQEDHDQGNDELPMDPALLKEEVLRLRRQVTHLQQQLQSRSCPTCQQRLALTDGHEQGAALMDPHSGRTGRLPAASVSSTAAAGPQQASRQAETKDVKRDHVTMPMEPKNNESKPTGQTWKQLQVQYQQLSGYPMDYQTASSRSSIAGTDVQNAAAELQPYGNISTAPTPTAASAIPHCNSIEAAYTALLTANVTVNDRWTGRPGASADITAATASSAGDGAERMSVVSETSDRASIWSMASLQSSILSYRSCLSPGTSRISVDGSGGVGSSSGGGSLCTAGASIQSGGALSVRGKCSESMLESKGESQSGGGGGSNCSDPCAVIGHGVGSDIPPGSRKSPEVQFTIERKACSTTANVVSATPCALPNAAAASPRAIAPASTCKRPGASPAGNACGALWDAPQPASRQPQSFPAQPSTAIRMSVDNLGIKHTQQCELRSGRIAHRSRQRPRRSCSDSGSDSDHSLAPDPDETAMPARPSTAPSRPIEAPVVRDRVELWQAQCTTQYNNSVIRASCNGSYGLPLATRGRGPSPSPQVSAGGSLSAAPLGSVIRTKYIPLDDDSDSGDSESDGILEQKYGIFYR